MNVTSSTGERLDALTGRFPDRPDGFVSYSRRDKAFVVQRLLPALAAADKAVWVDVEDIPPAADWRATVLDGIGKSSAFVFVLSPDSLRSEMCGEELERAVSLNKRLIPVACRDVDALETPSQLQRANWILLRAEDDFESGLGKLIDAMETDLEWRQMHTRVTVRATEWAREGQDRSFLLRGSDLESAERWLARQGAHTETATAEQADYILHSRAAATRRQRAVLSAVITALAISITLAILALTQRQEAIRQARVAASRELAATSLSMTGRDPELSVLLARQSSRTASTAEATNALRQSLLRWPERRALSTGEKLRGAEYSPDGRLLVTAGNPVGLYDAVSGRLLRRLPSPGGDVVSARFGPVGRQVLIAAADGSTIVDTTSGQSSARFPRDAAPLGGARFDRRGRRVILAAATGARVHDAGSGRRLATLKAPLTADALLAPDGKLAVTFGPTPIARVWRISTGRQIATLHHARPLVGAALSPSGRLLATATLSGLVTVWKLPSGRLVERLRHPTAVSGVSFSPDGRRLFTTSSFGKMWDVRRRRTLRELRQDSQVLASAFSPDGRRIATGDIDGVGRVWDVSSGRLINRLAGHGRQVDSVSFSPDGRFVVTGSRDETARIWEVAPGSSALSLRRGGETVRDAGFSPDGRTIATADEGGVLRLWDARSGRLMGSRQGPGGALTSLAYSSDGSTLITGGEAGRARIHRARDGRPLTTLRSHRGTIHDVALSPDARYAATAGEDSTLRLWDARSGRSLVRLGPFGEQAALSADFALGGMRVVSQIGGGVGLAESPSGRELKGFADAFAVAVSPDGRTLAVGGLHHVTLRSAADGRQAARFAAGDGIYTASFSRTGRFLAGVGSSGAAYAWDLRTRRRALHLRNPSVFALAIGPSERFAAAGRDDGRVSIYELGSEQAVATYGQASRGRALSVEFGRGDRSVLTREDHGGAWVFPCDVCRSRSGLVDLVDERAPRELTQDERQRYLHEEPK